MRGLGGISAVAAGLIYAALVQRISRPAATVLGLTLLGAFSAVGTVSEWPMLATFCLGIGAATAILNPTLQSGAAACFATPAEQGRAATMVTATTTLTAVLAAPVLGALSLLVGWRGLLWTVAALSLTAAAVLAGTSSQS
ncbi:MAG TPA: MFS transporter, partial [Corynebacterium sp.]|uniref:MFS transporter n=2 Tax=Corynebacterium TaxID=1716 RepID=UPI0017D51DC3|nr:MFS transporter [Corynebacterium sp.]